MPTTREILAKLISFDTTSRNPNKALIDYIANLLQEHGIESVLIPNEDNTKANLYATIGPADKPGIMLSGHTDVVPVDGQDWTKPAFELTESDQKYYGRGTADMKGFVACALSAAINAHERRLVTPLHLAFSYDEEIGCVGVHSLLDMLQQAPVKPSMCIVGEPTSLTVATKHKGKTSILATCIGKEGHSALAPNALNAIHLACDLVAIVRNKQEEIRNQCSADDLSDVPYTTVHVGRIHAGQALNIVPNHCTVNFEIRNDSADNPQAILDDIYQSAEALVQEAKKQATEAAINFDILNTYPGLNTGTDTQVVEFVKSLVGANDTSYVAFGTEGGLFSTQLNIPTVVCGPGSMAQGHKPDEFIEVEQMQRCEQMMQRLVQCLETEQGLT